MKKRTPILIAALACAVVGGTASAGFKLSGPVVISGTLAFGTVGDARASANTVEYIGCSVTGSTTSGLSATCGARDANSNNKSCSTSDPGLVQVAANVKAFSWIAFTHNTSGQCLTLAVYNYSYYPPMVP